MGKTRASKNNGKSRESNRVRYKNDAFLEALGQNCRKLREQKGYSIDRLYKEADRLSPASIDRLENGKSDSQILVLFRYAETLGLKLTDLFSFLESDFAAKQDSRVIPYDPEIKPPAGYVPVYPLKVAAGKFSQEENVDDMQPLGWVEAHVRAHHEQYFAASVRGESMEPLIKNGSLCLFRKYVGGSRQGKIFLVQAKGLKDTETGEAFVVKKYQRQTPPRSASDETESIVHLVSLNPIFPPIVLVGLSDDSIKTIAEFVRVI